MNGHLHVLHAAELWCLGDQKAAERALIEAEREATQHDFPAVLVEARALRARILLSLGRDDAARSEGRAAVAVADSIGQLRRAREIERALGLTHTRVTQSASVPTSARAVLAQHTAQRERDVLLQVTLAASRELEPEAQARAVLDRLIGLLGAERGLIFADYGAGALRAVAARSASREDLEPSQTYAKSLVRRVRASGVPIVMSGTEEGASLGSESVVAANLRSMVCAPIRLADQILGVIYLDSSLARGVFTRGDLEILEAIGGQIALSQEMARAARLEIERREIDKDLQLSGAVQSLLLPSSRELSKGPVRLSAAYSPASHSGGDFWSYEVLADGRIWVLLADATGHGAGAAMVTALLAGSYRTLIDAGAHDLRRFVEALNRSLTHLCAGRHAATLTALELDPSGQRMRTLCAGAPPVLVCRPGAPAEPIVLRGTPLGSEPFALGEQTVALTPGTRVLTVTDGVLEMPTVDGRELGARRLSRLLEKHAATEVPLARDQIMNELRLASQGCPVEDDLTLLLLGIAER
jgi:serine phosphatase RsbU (regulator of sigma subunit)